MRIANALAQLVERCTEVEVEAGVGAIAKDCLKKEGIVALKVFISYASHDIEVVDFVRAILTNPAVEAYVAEYDLPSGAQITPDLLQRIKDCDLFILLWSTNAKSSDWVPQEIGAAKAHGRPIIPVILHAGLKPPGFISDLKAVEVPRDPNAAFTWLRDNVLAKAQEKQKQEGLAIMAIAGALLWLFSKG